MLWCFMAGIPFLFFFKSKILVIDADDVYMFVFVFVMQT